MAGPRKSALTAALVICLCTVPLAAAGGPTTLPAWGTEPSSNGGFPRNAFVAVDALSSTDAWAIGNYWNAGFNHPRPLVQRWDGSAWSIVPTPWNQESELFGVAAIAPDDVWMVGGYQQGGQALIAHWDGTDLAVVPHPNPGTFNRLYSVAAISEDDVWAVGEFTNPISRTLALHWDGTEWTHVPTPNGSEGYNQLSGVTAVASDDVWAVGEDGNLTLTLHWDGSQWSRVSSPTPESYASLRAVSASASGDVWAVGDSGDESLTLRWDGSQWNVVPSPSPGMNFLDLNGVVARSPNDAWAVGHYDVAGRWKTLTMHWDGSEWAVVGSPSPDPVINVLSAVTDSPSGALWTVGQGGATGSLALQWNGASWERAQSDNAGTGENVLNAISVRSADDIWAVGHAQLRSLTMHYDGSAWTIVPSPDLEFGVRLEDVVAIAPNDAWAVGWSPVDQALDHRSVAMHWDGTEWSILPTPQPGGAYVDQLRAVDAAGPNDVWATGTYQDAQTNYHSLILHWDGTEWSVVPHNCDTLRGLTGITVLSATDVWAVGDSTTCHYDGSSWTEVPSPQPRPQYNELSYPLEDVSGTSGKNVWAVGARVVESYYYVSFSSIAEHWNGAQWTLVTTVPGQFLYGVEAVSPDDVWAVGTNGYGPLIAHFDGSEWSSVPTPEAGRGGRLAGVDSAMGAHDASPQLGGKQLWAAGYFSPGYAGNRTLIQSAPSSTQGAVVGEANVGHATISWFGPETGSTETNASGAYGIGGLLAGTYTFTATNPGCTPDVETVTVTAGQTLTQDFQIGCSGRPKS
jgi:hypothetical protein